MKSQIVISGAAIALAFTATVGAQRQVALGQEDPAVTARRSQLQLFEAVIERAIVNGGGRLAERARQLLPDIELWLEGTPQVSAVPVPDIGIVVDVQIPDVNAASRRLFDLMRDNLPRVANNGGAPTMSAAELMDFDVGREYGTYVRDSLANAMVDNAKTLVLEAHERLVVVGRVMAQSPLALETKRKLVLQILATDLSAYDNGEITREELKARIIESRF